MYRLSYTELVNDEYPQWADRVFSISARSDEDAIVIARSMLQNTRPETWGAELVKAIELEEA